MLEYTYSNKNQGDLMDKKQKKLNALISLHTTIYKNPNSFIDELKDFSREFPKSHLLQKFGLFKLHFDNLYKNNGHFHNVPIFHKYDAKVIRPNIKKLKRL